MRLVEEVAEVARGAASDTSSEGGDAPFCRPVHAGPSRSAVRPVARALSGRLGSITPLRGGDPQRADQHVMTLVDQPSVISFDSITLAYGRQTIIRDLSLEIRRGQIVCIIGPSGCGKTTALRMAGGLVRPDSGSVNLLGERLTAPRRDVAIVFQDYGKALLPWRTAAANVSLALEAAGIPRAERDARIRTLLAKVGLDGHEGKYPTEMSGGMQQRIQIARCLAQDPAVLLMDEPFGALDAMTRQGLQDEMLSIVAETGATVFFVTHDLEEAVYLGDRVIGLLPNPGRIGIDLPVDLPRPRNQLETREMPEFLHLRRELFKFIKKAEG